MEENNDFSVKTSEKKEERKKWVMGLLVAAVLGVISGWGIYRYQGQGEVSFGKKGEVKEAEGKKVKKGEIYGRKDDVFKDSAVGVVERGGIDGEGTHRLIREGGESQTAYLTSSVLDLDLFVGHKVKVWGQTFAGEKAGWLMDVGRVEVLE